MNQLQFNFTPLSRRSDTQGSNIAANHVKSKANTHAFLILSYMQDNKSEYTSKQLSDILGIDRHAVARRMTDLERLCKIKRAGFTQQTKEQLWASV